MAPRARVTKCHAVDDSIEFVTSGGKANEMLGTKFALYRYLDGDRVLRTQNYRLPVEMVRHTTWQEANVTQYIKELNGKHQGLYNVTGRGIPDVSLLGDDYLTLTAGFPSTHDGTSASAPLFAAMIALINDIRLRIKKPALEFLNPLLYAAKTQSVYKDISDYTQSRGCADRNFIAPGWQALKGCDAATGLGKPDFAKLRTLLA